MPINIHTLGEFLAWSPPPAKVILGKGILYEDGKLIIYGKYKTFKSMLAKAIAMCIAYGEPFQGDIEVAQGGASVCYLQSEISEIMLHKRLTPMFKYFPHGGGPQPLKPIWIATSPFLLIDSFDGLEELKELLATHRPEVLIIDPVYKFISGSITNPDTVAHFLRIIDQLIAEFHCAVILIHHTRKPPVGTIGEAQNGSSDDMVGAQTFSAWADGIIKVQPKGGSELGSRDNIVLKMEVMRHAEEEIDPIELFFDRHTLQFKNVTIKF